ncbi:hypothetical protein LTR78_003935 [Recurvomyces mirabilis]|uniref:Uncharacterized protein n=1 Tax=Recurvomyces mirabilis TaxID=574656 RepID=A0AAE0WQR7_9PEZI|nr:hypothetical protein LTR78_003935 [Recurvomyces mirabilis]KAK5153927.1 hypothetical protein LTS14_007147 [Recurvomyces mirabilis]
MPLLSRRRSLLDLLNVADDGNLPRPSDNTNTLSAPTMVVRPASEHGYAPSRLSHELLAGDVVAPGAVEGNRKRFSMMKLRNYSESHLSAKAKEDALKRGAERPPMPALPSHDTVPAIVKTAPTMEHGGEEVELEPERRVRPSLFKRSTSRSNMSENKEPRKSMDNRRPEKVKGSSLSWRRKQGRSTGLEDLARLSSIHAQQNSNNNRAAPPSYGEEADSALALPVPDPRSTEPRESDESNGSGDIYGQTTTTTHTVSTHTTFFKLPRRNKNRNSLFPLPVKLPPPGQLSPPANEPATPRASTSAYSTKSAHSPDARSPPLTLLQRRHTGTSPTKQRDRGPRPPLPSTASALAKGGLAFAEPSMSLDRNGSHRSRGSSTSSPLQPPMRLGMRDRASTASSFGQQSHEMDTPPPLTVSGRDSSSTTGRSSFGGLLTLSRFRGGSQPDSPRHSSPGTRSKSNSFAISREVVLVIPEREEGDTPGKYLERLEAAVARSMIAGILSKSADPFAQAVLRSYTRRFAFFGEPIDMSLRKFLLEAELPKETQQVDRVIQAFADRYHECNPGIFKSPDQAYVIAFSLMMLHTDAFNKNNKRKMQRHDYIKNTSGQHVADEVLGCFYDNICYTPFVHYEEEVDINGERVMPFKPKKSKLKGALPENGMPGKKPSGPVDPYNLLVDQKLDMLRPVDKDSVAFDDPYNYRSNAQGELDLHYLQRAFTHTGILQIISARSRPTAYEGTLTANNPNPAETQAGIIDLKITKVGTLWRKSAKKKKTRSPWQEWGAILTGSQLYLFKNAHWAKGLVHQFTAAQRPGQPRTPVIFKPPLSDFKPDALIKTDNAAALIDNTYNRHKNAFTFFRAGGQEEVLLADNEPELHDWLALINYAAAFRAAGVRIRGMVGGNEEDLRRRESSMLESGPPVRQIQSASGEVTVMRGALSPQLQRQVMAARRQIMVQKIAESEQEVAETNKKLEDRLRDARHLLILAPIAPKSREDVIHAAARSDAMIKWLRRDIWRIKTHRDILAMDVQLDGMSSSQLHTLTSRQASAVEAIKRVRASSLVRDTSKTIMLPRSPPQSPTSPARSRKSERPSATGSIETFMGNDVFATPPETASEAQPSDTYRLPPLQLNVQQSNEHRGSVTSTLLSVSSPGRGTLSHASSTSSVRQLERQPSEQPSEAPSRKVHATPVHNERDHEVEMLARTTVQPDTTPRLPANLDGTSPAVSTPDNKHKGVRRSLQKTLREAQQNAGSVHRHRRGKESDGTIRSGGGEGSAIAGEEGPEGTPQLHREKGRFILHGKQASVIQFGNDWPNERMKQRRERWRRDSTSTNAASPRDETTPRPTTGSRAESQAEFASPSVGTGDREFGFGQGTGNGNGMESEEESEGTAASHEFREDVEAAHAFATSAGSSSPEDVRRLGGGGAEEYFDAVGWDPKAAAAASAARGKRTTVIGPKARDGQAAPEPDQGAESDVDDYSLGPRDDRRTVIGSLPDTSSHNIIYSNTSTTHAPAKAHAYKTSDISANGGAEQERDDLFTEHEHEHGYEDHAYEGVENLEEEEEGEDDSMISGPIEDEELRRMTQRAVPTIEVGGKVQ